jgi:hypothetical protein
MGKLLAMLVGTVAVANTSESKGATGHASEISFRK